LREFHKALILNDENSFILSFYQLIGSWMISKHDTFLETGIHSALIQPKSHFFQKYFFFINTIAKSFIILIPLYFSFATFAFPNNSSEVVNHLINPQLL